MGPLPYGDRPDKKDGSRKESDMKLQWIKDILGDAYTEELDAKVSAALGERFVSRADFKTAASPSWKPRWASWRSRPRPTPRRWPI